MNNDNNSIPNVELSVPVASHRVVPVDREKESDDDNLIKTFPSLCIEDRKSLGPD